MNIRPSTQSGSADLISRSAALSYPPGSADLISRSAALSLFKITSPRVKNRVCATRSKNRRPKKVCATKAFHKCRRPKKTGLRYNFLLPFFLFLLSTRSKNRRPKKVCATKAFHKCRRPKKTGLRYRFFLFLLSPILYPLSPVFGQQPATQSAPLVRLNVKYVNGVGPGYAPTAGTGLTLNLGVGTAFCGGAVISYAGGTLTMTASATNNVYLNSSASCAPAVKTTAFSSADIPVAIVTTNATTITGITDIRTMFVPAVAGGAGAGTGSCIASQFVTGVNASPTAPTCAQPAFSNLSGSIALGQSPLTTLGDILSVNSTPALARVAGNTTTVRQFFSQTGTGTVSAVPAWVQPGFGDLSGIIQVGQLNLASTGDMVSVSAGAPARVAGNITTTKQYLTQTGTGTASALPVWAQGAFADLSGTVAISQGGTGQTTASAAFNALSPMTTLGDIIFGGAAGAGTRLAGNTTATPQYLKSLGGGGLATAPTFSQIAFGDLTGTATDAQLANAYSGVGSCTNQVVTALTRNAAPTCSSVLGTMFANQSANLIFGGPSSGAASAPSFRSLVPPDVTFTALGDILYGGTSGAGSRLAGNTTTTKQYLTQTGTGSISAAPVWAQGAFADLAGVVSIAQGGTGQATAAAAFNALSPITSTGDLILGTGINTAGRLAIGAAGQCLTVSGGTAAWGSCAAGTVGGSGTTNAIAKFTAAATIGNSLLTDDGAAVTVGGPLALGGEGRLGSQALTTTVTNATTTGTTLNALAKLTGAPATAVITTTGDTGGVLGVIFAGAGTTGSARITHAGQASCIFDGANTAGNYVQISGLVGGACKDAGAAIPTSAQVLGRSLSTNAVIAAPAAATGSTATTGGTIAAGTYRIAVTLVNSLGGETTISADAASTITTTGTTSTLTDNAPASAAGAVGWRPYVSAAGGAAGSETLQTITATQCTLATGITVFNACAFGANWTNGSIAAGAAVPGANTAGTANSILLFGPEMPGQPAVFASRFTGADVGAQIQAAINSQATNGGWVIADFQGNQTITSAVTIKPGVWVYAYPAKYTVGVGAQVIVNEAGHLIGSGTSNATGQGTVFTAANSLNNDVIHLVSTAGPTAWWHWGSIEWIRVEGNSANQTTGNGILVDRIGENSIIAHVLVNNAKLSGIRYNSNLAGTSSTEDVHCGNNQLYGFEFNGTTSTHRMASVGGDTNASALIAIIPGSGGFGLIIDKLKSEAATCGTCHDPVILIDSTTSDTVLSVRGAVVSASATHTDFIKFQNTGNVPYIVAEAVISLANYTNMYRDITNGVTVASASVAPEGRLAWWSWSKYGVVNSQSLALSRFDRSVANGANQNVTLGPGGTGAVSFVRLTGPTAAFNIGGFSPQGSATPVDGRLLFVVNGTSQTMTINNLDNGSSANNQIITGTGTSVQFPPTGNSSAEFIYETADNKWVLLGGALSYQTLTDLKVSLGTYPTINFNPGLVYGFVPTAIAVGTKAATTDCGYSGTGAATVFIYANESGVACNTSGFPATGAGFWSMGQFAFAPPAAPTVTTAATGGTIAAGTYLVALTYNFAGETPRSLDSTITTTGTTSTITVTAPPASGGATGWRIYTSTAGGANSTETLQSTNTTFSGTVTLTSLVAGAAFAPTFAGISVTDQRGFRAWGLTPGSGFTLAAPSTGNVQLNYDSNVLADLTTAQNMMNKSSGQTFTAGTGGTTINLLVKGNGANPTGVITTATTDTGTGIVIGIALQTVAATASVKVATRGTATCVADNAVTAGDWIQVGTTTAGRCRDTGATFPTSGDVVGQAQSSATVGNTFTVNLDNRQRSPGGGGGGITTLNPGTNTGPTVTLQTGTTGTDFNLSNPAANQIQFNLPDASATARGAVTTGVQTFAGVKSFNSSINFNSTIGTVNGSNVNGPGVPGIQGLVSTLASSASVTGATIVSAGSVLASLYRISYYLWQSAAGAGCTGNATVTARLHWTDPSGTAQNWPIAAATTGLPTSGNTMQNTIPVGNYEQNTVTVRSNGTTALTYDTTFTAGAGCTTQPQYSIRVNAEFMGN